jgi:hypothetical protein
MSDLDFLTGRRAPSDLDPLYDALALPADRQHGIDSGPDSSDAADGVARGYAFNQWMPFTTNRVGSASWVTNGADPQWSVPQVLRDGAKGWLDLARAKDTGSLTPEALGAFLTGSLGAGMSGAPAGALAAGGGRGRVSPLPLDEASRYSRAREQGFRPELKLYHGTAGDDFSAFARNPTTTTMGLPSVGVWAAENPVLTNPYSELAAQTRGGGARTIPLMARWDRLGNIRLDGTETLGEVMSTVGHNFDRGFDAIRFPNFTTVPGLGPQTAWVFRDPNQLRSRFARFDPAKRDSDDLLAARAVPGFNFVPPPAPPEPGFRVPVKAGRSAAEMEF